ncbi:hypothetical protein [Streptomyces niveiscabiei]|uniref:hypothetical protein n=2 Tax=Streptomyces niveiscabiei TaxID=164115 RepID=UPI0006EB4AB4|nr:hypothetical protein [Streptomyces niveiscabiei]
MLEPFEISFMASLSWDDLRTALSEHLRTPIENVVMFGDWLDLPPKRQGETTSLDIIRQEVGYRTLVDGMSPLNVGGEKLGFLAAALAMEFSTSVAIGDYTHDCGYACGRFIVCRPDGRIFFALEKSGGEFWDLELL